MRLVVTHLPKERVEEFDAFDDESLHEVWADALATWSVETSATDLGEVLEPYALCPDYSDRFGAGGEELAQLAAAEGEGLPAQAREAMAAGRHLVVWLVRDAILEVVEAGLRPWAWLDEVERLIAEDPELLAHFANGSVLGKPFLGLREPGVPDGHIPTEAPFSLRCFWRRWHMGGLKGQVEILHPETARQRSASLDANHLVIAEDFSDAYAVDLRQPRANGEYAISRFDAAHGWCLETEHGWDSVEQLMLSSLWDSVDASCPTEGKWAELRRVLQDAMRR